MPDKQPLKQESEAQSKSRGSTTARVFTASAIAHTPYPAGLQHKYGVQTGHYEDNRRRFEAVNPWPPGINEGISLFD